MIRKKTIAGKPIWKYWADKRKESKPLKRTGIKQKFYPKKNKIPGLFEFMSGMVGKCSWVCDECGVYCYSPDPKFQLAAQAHILEKKIFRSVALVPENILCLPSHGCGCHKKFDHSYERKTKMKVWPKAQEIILTVLIPRLPAQEYVKLPDFLKELYEKRMNATVN